MSRRFWLAGLLSALTVCGSAVSAGADDFVWLSQGAGFDETARDGFYSQDQGSRMMPYAWLKALRHPDGSSFLSDSLARYGYLANPKRDDGLPVGFTRLEASGPPMVGMTCSACHTRQIVSAGVAYRIDGGPALVDFQRLLTDLDAAVGVVLADPAAFAAFAADAKTSDPSTDPDTLRSQVENWFKPFDAIVSASITKAAGHTDWGYGRLDAISMIFNRVSGLDIGDGPDRIIDGNMKPANAPARYPFLWNAAREAKTQWPGFAPNDPLGGALGRNVGEVMGVFARFDPQSRAFAFEPYKPDSVNFEGMEQLELWAASIPAPKWPWSVDDAKAARGAKVYETACRSCHGVEDEVRGLTQRPTPVKDVCTDGAEVALLGRRIVKAGVLKGAPVFTPQFDRVDDNSLEVDVLKSAAVGAILQHLSHPLSNAMSEFGGLDLTTAAQLGDRNAFRQLSARAAAPLQAAAALPALQAAALQRLPGASKLTSVFAAPGDAEPIVCDKRKPDDPPAAYEARYLGGVWAVAPYLHDGSVATLKDLLKPAIKRQASFKVGPNYDPAEVGLAADQPDGASSTLITSDCSDLGSGRSRCGHEYGVDLTDEQKDDLLEYLKTM